VFAEIFLPGKRLSIESSPEMRRLLLWLLIPSLIALVIRIHSSIRVISDYGTTAHVVRIGGKRWHFDLDFPISNPLVVEKLIECESQGLNISRPDSNGQISWGVLQFNGTSTWNEMERRFHFYGDPRNPPEAIHMADIMISNGFVGRWTCARSLGFVK
jgi:hypothetical protein